VKRANPLMEMIMPKGDSESSTENELDQNGIEASSASTNEDIKNNSEGSSTLETSKVDTRTTLDLVEEAISSADKDQDETKGNQEDDLTESEDKSKDESKDKSKDKFEDEDDEDSEETEEQLKDWKKQLKAETRERFEKLQKRDFEKKQEIESLKAKVQEVEVDAGFKHQYTEFLTGNNITNDEANTLFDIGAAMKRDPNKALELMTPYYNSLLEVTGNVLPPDLAQQVKDGYINDNHAYELSRQRATINHSKSVAIAQQQATQQTTQNNNQKLNVDIQGALAGLENQWKESDPDYKVKSSRIEDKMKLTWFEMSRNGKMPRSVEEATSIANKIKSDVETEMRSFTRKKAVSTVDSGGIAPNIKPEPKSTLDIINQVCGG